MLKKVPDEIMAQIIRYDWPGNVRELENVIQRGVIFGEGKRFHLTRREHISSEITSPEGFASLKEAERQHILDALNRSRWKIHGPGGAAEMLDMNSRTLASRMRRLGITRR
jgi:transcriptional regulator with GAF, ATPase, and Fis domain